MGKDKTTPIKITIQGDSFELTGEMFISIEIDRGIAHVVQYINGKSAAFYCSYHPKAVAKIIDYLLKDQKPLCRRSHRDEPLPQIQSGGGSPLQSAFSSLRVLWSGGLAVCSFVISFFKTSVIYLSIVGKKDKNKPRVHKITESFPTFKAYLERLIKITHRCITKDASFLRKETVQFHKGQHKAYKDALAKYKEFTNESSKKPESTFITFATFEDFQSFIIKAVAEDISNHGAIRTAINRCIQELK